MSEWDEFGKNASLGKITSLFRVNPNLWRATVILSPTSKGQFIAEDSPLMVARLANECIEKHTVELVRDRLQGKT